MPTPADVMKGVGLALQRRVAPMSDSSFLRSLPSPVRVSSLGSCGRQTVLKTLHPEAQTTPGFESSYAMLQGDWAETGMAKLLTESGFIIKDAQLELSLTHEGKEVLRGHIDGYIGFETGLPGFSDWSLWENKAMSSFRFKKLNAGGVKEACPEYWTQTQTYMWLSRLGNGGGTPVTDCLFSACAKDPSAANMGVKGPRLNPIYMERIPFDQEYADGCIERAIRLSEDIEARVEHWPQEREPGKDWDCSEKFCAVFALCSPVKGGKRG